MIQFLSKLFTTSPSPIPIQPVPKNQYYYHFGALVHIVDNSLPPKLVIPSHASNILSMKYMLELAYYFAAQIPFKDSEIMLDKASRGQGNTLTRPQIIINSYWIVEIRRRNASQSSPWKCGDPERPKLGRFSPAGPPYIQFRTMV